MVARLDTPLGPLTVANTHLSFVPGWNRVQLRHLVRDLRGFPGPRVLMGDLNMTPPKPAAGRGMRPLGAAPTFPADEPSRQLDHILTDDPTLRADDCRPPRCRSRIIGRLLWTFRGRDYVGWRRGVRRDLRGVDGPLRRAGRTRRCSWSGSPTPAARRRSSSKATA